MTTTLHIYDNVLKYEGNFTFYVFYLFNIPHIYIYMQLYLKKNSIPVYYTAIPWSLVVCNWAQKQ